MTAVRYQIAMKGAALLQAAAFAQEVEVMPSGDPVSFPALHLFDLGQEPALGEAGTERFILSLGIDGYVEQADGPEALAALNALYTGVIETLFPQPYFDGLVEEIDQGRLTVNVAERANARRLAFSLDLNISYATRRGLPQQID